MLKTVRCDNCAQDVIALEAPAGAPEIYVEFECIRDGVSCIHPGKIRLGGADGVVVVESPHGFEIGPPITFNESAWRRLIENAG